MFLPFTDFDKVNSQPLLCEFGVAEATENRQSLSETGPRYSGSDSLALGHASFSGNRTEGQQLSSVATMHTSCGNYGADSALQTYSVPASLAAPPQSAHTCQPLYQSTTETRSWNGLNSRAGMAFDALTSADFAATYAMASPLYQSTLPYQFSPSTAGYQPSALDMASLQSSLPPPERRLPRPNLPGGPDLPSSTILRRSLTDNNMTGLQGRQWSLGLDTTSGRRQSSIYDLAHVSSMMPPVARSTISSSPSASPQDYFTTAESTPAIGALMAPPYVNGNVLPPLATSGTTSTSSYELLPPANFGSFSSTDSRRESEKTIYSWRPATVDERNANTDMSADHGESYNPIEQPQPRHVPNLETLGRESSSRRHNTSRRSSEKLRRRH